MESLEDKLDYIEEQTGLDADQAIYRGVSVLAQALQADDRCLALVLESLTSPSDQKIKWYDGSSE